MAAIEPTIKKREFVNWIKGAISLLFAKQGMDGFVSDELKDFQRDILASIFRNKGLPAGTVCTSCTTENVLDCPTQNYCSKGKCKLHDPCKADKQPNQACPNRLCQSIRDGIRLEHRYNGPSWKNTDARGWSNDAFEIAKCYMPPDGYTGVSKLADTDFNGTLAVIINNIRFQNKMAAKLHQSNNVCIKAREVGRSIRHSANLNVTDNDLAQYIDVLIDLLSDPKYIAADQRACESVDKLRQLKSNTLTVTTADITAVLDSTIKDKQEKALQAIKDETEEASGMVQEQIKASIQLMEDAKAATANLQTVLVSSLSQIIAAKQSSIDEIKTEAEKQKQEIAKAGAEEREKIEKDVLLQQQSVPNVEDTANTHVELARRMKKDLVSFYRKFYSTIPISPIVEEHDAPLTDFYVQPPLTAIDVQRKFGRAQEHPTQTQINSYRDLFIRSDCEMYKDIYITAKAGVGKTSFAKKICMTWCQAHSPTETLVEKFKPEDIDVMKKFELLFMVSLRDTSACDLDSIIERSILNSLGNCSRYSKGVLEDLLNDNTVLVLVDGLDEWVHPTSCKRGCRDVHAIPHIPARETCTTMTTTRPWKFNAIKLGNSEIDRHIEINELDESSSHHLVSNVVDVLNIQSGYSQSRTVKEFESTASVLKLGNMRYIPYILLQMICLWFDGKSIGRSKREVYTNITTLTLSRGLLKLEKKGLPQRKMQDLASERDIPPRLPLNDTWKSHNDVLIGLAELAFKMLFSPTKESHLVLDASEVLCILSEDVRDFCLNIGLLSKNKVFELVSERRSTYSFQHKSVQEYFAAFYIQSRYDNQDTGDIICKVCGTLPEVLEMSNVFVFLAGFSSSACGKIFQTCEDALETDERIEFFRNNPITGHAFIPKLQEYWPIMKTFQGMKIDMVREIRSSGGQTIPFYLEDIVIDSSISIEECCLIKHLTESNKHKVKSLSISECRSTEEFTEKLETLDMQNAQSLHKLMIDAVPKDQDLQRLLAGSVQTLTCLYIAFSTFEGQLEFKHSTLISSETIRILSRMNNLQTIALESICLKHVDIKLLFHYLNARRTMLDVGLSNIRCTDHGEDCDGDRLDLSQNHKMSELELENVPVSLLKVNVSSLKVCIIGALQKDVLLSLVNCLPEAKQLCTVSFDLFPREESPMIISTIPKLLQLETLSIQQCFLFDIVFTLPPEMIRLELVHLYDVIMDSDSLRSLIDSVNVLPQQIIVKLEACDVQPEESYTQCKNDIRLSSMYQVLFDGQNTGEEYLFSFQTCK